MRGQRTYGLAVLAAADVDDRAMKVAISFGGSLGATVKRVDDQNHGWDLEFHFDDVWWPVEVKGMADERKGFILTRTNFVPPSRSPATGI